MVVKLARFLRLGLTADTTRKIPLELEVELPATGQVQVVIEEPGNAKTGVPAEGFRGHYLLTVTPERGANGLLLEPQPDVEP